MSAPASSRRTRWMGGILIFLACVGAARSVQAEDKFPTRPLRLIVPYVAGGVGDLVARTVAAQVGVDLGQPVIVENRPGADGVIGTQAAATAAPDGYTILQVSTAQVVAMCMKEPPPFDMVRDFTEIARVGFAPLVLLVPAASSAKSVADLVNLAKSKAGAATYGAGGVGSLAHLSAELFKRATAVSAVNVQYKGSAAVVVDLIGGRLDWFFGTGAEAIQNVRAGKLRALAVTSPKRSPDFPDVPTMLELGFKDFTPAMNVGYSAPLKTPAPIVKKLQEAIVNALAAPAVKERLSAIGVITTPGNGDDLVAMIKGDVDRWGKIIKESGIRRD